jgi:hypothetical protein
MKNKGCEARSRSLFAAISDIGSVADALPRASDRLLWVRFGSSVGSTGPVAEFSPVQDRDRRARAGL